MSTRTFGNTRPAQLGGYVIHYGDLSLSNGNVLSSVFQCCGLRSIQSFGAVSLPNFAAKAAYLAGLYLQLGNGHQTLVFVTNPRQESYTAHDITALKECGAVCVHEFPNLQPGHSGYMLKMYFLDLNLGIGKFFDVNGVAYKEPPGTVKEAAQKAAVAVKASSVLN